MSVCALRACPLSVCLCVCSQLVSRQKHGDRVFGVSLGFFCFKNLGICLQCPSRPVFLGHCSCWKFSLISGQFLPLSLSLSLSLSLPSQATCKSREGGKARGKLVKGRDLGGEAEGRDLGVEKGEDAKMTNWLRDQQVNGECVRGLAV